ncbi:hypothetical protein B0H13DRAFT_2535029, partial [Mycena leptocephala]
SLPQPRQHRTRFHQALLLRPPFIFHDSPHRRPFHGLSPGVPCWRECSAVCRQQFFCCKLPISIKFDPCYPISFWAKSTTFVVRSLFLQISCGNHDMGGRFCGANGVVFDDVFEYERKSVKQCALCIDFVVFTAHFTRRFSYRSEDKDHVVPTVPVPATLLKEPHSFKVQNDSTMSAHKSKYPALASPRRSACQKCSPPFHAFFGAAQGLVPSPERRRFDQDLFKTFEASDALPLRRFSSTSPTAGIQPAARASPPSSASTHATLHELPELPTGSDLLRCTAIRWRSRRATCGGIPHLQLRFTAPWAPTRRQLETGSLTALQTCSPPTAALQLDFLYLRILTRIPTVHLVVLHPPSSRAYWCRKLHRAPSALTSTIHTTYTTSLELRTSPTATNLPRCPATCGGRVGSRDRRHIPTSGATTIGGSSRRCSQPTLCASELGYHEPVGLRKHGGGAALGSAGVWIGCTYEDVMGWRWGCGRDAGRRLAGKTVK